MATTGSTSDKLTPASIRGYSQSGRSTTTTAHSGDLDDVPNVLQAAQQFVGDAANPTQGHRRRFDLQSGLFWATPTTIKNMNRATVAQLNLFGPGGLVSMEAPNAIRLPKRQPQRTDPMPTTVSSGGRVKISDRPTGQRCADPAAFWSYYAVN